MTEVLSVSKYDVGIVQIAIFWLKMYYFSMAEKKKTKRKKHPLRKILILLAILVALFILLCFLSPTESDANGTVQIENVSGLELPTPIEGEQIIKHTGYTLSYNEKHEQPSYVAYVLAKENLFGENEREDDFRPDPSVMTGSATLDDYRSSGYDRGHMAPAADFKWSEDAMSDTFYLSNMSPQVQAFNRGIWANLESAVREMAYENDVVYVVTGPVLTDGPYKTIGKSKVSVPKRYYKVILDYTEPDLKAIGFVLENEKSDKSIESCAVSVDEVERITGIDFYPLLPDDQEEEIESSLDLSKWSFRQFSASCNDAGMYSSNRVAGEPSKAEEIITFLLDEVFYEFKREVFKSLGIMSEAKELGLI